MKHHKRVSAAHTSLSWTAKSTALPQILAEYLSLLIFLWLQTISWSFGWKRITSLIDFEADFTQHASYTEFIKSERCPDVRFHNTGCIMSPNISNACIMLANNSVTSLHGCRIFPVHIAVHRVIKKFPLMYCSDSFVHILEQKKKLCINCTSLAAYSVSVQGNLLKWSRLLCAEGKE